MKQLPCPTVKRILRRSTDRRRSGNLGSVSTASAPWSGPFDGNVANIARDWSISMAATAPGPPKRIDGCTVGVAANLDGPGPHGGEVHPDGDELLYVVSGTMEVIFDDGDEHAVGAVTTVLLHAGEACVVPRGVLHRVEAVEPSCLVHVTPGPNGGHRPRSAIPG